ncbi:MAG TPA: hypothetical protein VFM21_10790 [Terriglobia bacterium]|nr:hypothetical protein [Terriglobia bacterium]
MKSILLGGVFLVVATFVFVCGFLALVLPAAKYAQFLRGWFRLFRIAVPSGTVPSTREADIMRRVGGFFLAVFGLILLFGAISSGFSNW